MKLLKSIAIITARGGSKRIPKKNIKEFCGKPIIAYSIMAAIQSQMFDKVIVSTDSYEIASVATQYLAEVPFLRSDNTSNDYATTADVLVEVLERYQELGIQFENFCCIYPTAPFVNAKKLQEAMSILEREHVDSVVPVVKYDFPPQRSFVINNGMIKYRYPEWATARSQDLEPMYHDCGQFYACKVSSFMEHKSVIMPSSFPLIIPSTEVQDIDEYSDWDLAEIKFSKLLSRYEE